MTMPHTDRTAPSSSTGSGRRHRLLLVPGVALLLAGVVVVVSTTVSSSTGHSESRAATSTSVGSQQPGAVDVGFCQDMTAHHAQAQLMAAAVVTRASPRIRTIALSILAGQSQESGTMKGWLAVWGESLLPTGPPMTWMHAHAAMDHTAHPGMVVNVAMPGMATQPELDRLSTMTGRALDVDFLQLMIRHHQGGIIMAGDAAAHARTSLVRSAAGEMMVDQTNENQLMLGLLRQLHARPLGLR